MEIITYSQFWDKVCELDIYFKDNLSYIKYKTLFLDCNHFEKIKKEYNLNPCVGLKLVAFMYFLSKFDNMKIFIHPSEGHLITNNTSIYNLTRLAKLKYNKKALITFKYFNNKNQL